MRLRLVWETNEFELPGSAVAKENEANGVTRWNVPDDWVEENENVDVESSSGRAIPKKDEGEKMIEKGFVRREVELADGTREVGFWVDVKEARVRVETRH